MLQIKNISKQYQTGDLIQRALDEVSLNLRDNEFVAILGPSGSGKTTMLNIIGGLDRYDDGDLIINEISTKEYRDRDWDSYRNHSVGFVFQSYNLIPHQSILSNVELALTISGISKKERRDRAQAELERVGLGDQIHKRPNQMSGGQMQRVAIARALVNNPDILLADEPTGALDSETSLQVMELLKEVAKDRLVVMVTHNGELAEKYANRIVRLRDGKIIDDTNPLLIDEANLDAPTHQNMGKASMSFGTSLSLSFNNLLTKKGRTLLTSFAGSIGIIGIALILSLSNGVNTYITDIQRETMASYPITIDAQAIDLTGVMGSYQSRMDAEKQADQNLDRVYSDGANLELMSKMSTSISENNLTEFKKYLDDPSSEIHQYLGENGIVYSYDVAFDVYAYDPDNALVNTNGEDLGQDGEIVSTGPPMGGPPWMNAEDRQGPSMGGMPSRDIFQELIPGMAGTTVSPVVTENYELSYGHWPEEADEVVLFLDEYNRISLSTLYALGYLPSSEYPALMDEVEADADFVAEEYDWTYEEMASHEFHLIPASDYYVDQGQDQFEYVKEDPAKGEELMEGALTLKITGIVRPVPDAPNASFMGAVGYISKLSDYLIDHANNSPVVRAQTLSKDTNVLTGFDFAPQDESAKIEDVKEYIAGLNVSDKAALWGSMLPSVYGEDPQAMQRFMTMDEAGLAQGLDQYLEDPQDEVMLSIYDNTITPGSYDDNMEAFGYVSVDAPASINIYADSFEDKDSIAAAIEHYNETALEENRITYTDFVKLLMSSVTTIINVISYVLIAFVGVSLVVSSIMIGIITYISVLERTKEIGILRAIGASKGNISQVFNAETFIIGLIAGLMGIGISLLILVPGNAVIHSLIGNTDMNAALPVGGAVILVLLSMLLTLIGGFIPAKQAAKKDPVEALRTD